MRLLAPALAAAALVLTLRGEASAQGWAERTGIYFRTGGVLTSLDPSALLFTADAPTNLRMGMPLAFTGKQLGWSRTVLVGGSLGVALDARWFYLRIGADLFEAPEITVQPARYRAQVLSLAWAAVGPRYAWGQFAVHVGARLGAAVMSLRSENGASEYTAINGTYAGEIGFQWRPLRWLQLDAVVSQDFAAVGVTTVTLALNLGWSRPR
ncbi:MAG: hypothetical protein U0325_16915 [Polyangiales bacterium]